jgi:hypothetical protein
MRSGGGHKTRIAISTAVPLVLVVGTLACLARPGRAETQVKEGVRVSVNGKLQPTLLPRHGAAPIQVRLGGRIGLVGGGTLPRLTRLTIELNRHGRFDTRGLPSCPIRDIRPSTTRQALNQCGAALVGEGSFSANVKLPEQSPFPSHGKVLAFNGRYRGRPAILAHIYGSRPLPTSYVLPFTIGRASGAFGTALETKFPEVTGEWGYVTGLEMSLHRRFAYRGRTHGYLSAGCPAPKGLTLVPFPLARTSFEFDSGLTISTTLNRTCRVRG